MHDLELRSLHTGPVLKYYNKKYWNEDISWFMENKYKVVKMNASNWITVDDMYSDLHEYFEFPTYFGRNLNAVTDCLRDLDFDSISGLLVTIENYDSWFSKNQKIANILLDIFANISYEKLIHGNKFIVYIQSNNPNLNLAEVGSRKIPWNQKEWLNSKRIDGQ